MTAVSPRPPTIGGGQCEEFRSRRGRERRPGADRPRAAPCAYGMLRTTRVSAGVTLAQSLDMARTVTVVTSPLNCRWIAPGSRRSFEAFEYAVCRREKDAERVVNEAECRYCPAWEPPANVSLKRGQVG